MTTDRERWEDHVDRVIEQARLDAMCGRVAPPGGRDNDLYWRILRETEERNVQRNQE